MRLDLTDKGVYVLSVPKSERKLIRDLRMEEGFDFNTRASTVDTAALTTREPYAAVQFFGIGSAYAKASLAQLQAEIDKSWATDCHRNIAMPPDEELWPFQKAGVAYALERQHTLIGDVPGLGKTPQAIAFCNETQAQRVLVICPAQIRLQWARMIRRFTTMQRPIVYPVLKGKHGVSPVANWIIVSYDLVRSEAIHAAIAKQDFDTCILDEAHYLKTPDAKRTQQVLGSYSGKIVSLASRAKRILGLTGTPLPNRPRECYTLTRGLCFDAIDWMAEQSFNDRFNPSNKWEEKTGRHGELQARLRGNFMVRREKHGERGVLSQLRLPQFDIIHIEPDAPIRRALQAERLLDIDPDHLPGPLDPIAGQIATVRREMGEAMAPHVGEYCRMLLEGGEENIVVFGHHISVLDKLQEMLNEYGVVRIDGRTGSSRKQTLVDSFRFERTTRVCLGNLLSMGVGTDGLQDVATHVVFAEADWVHGNNQQGVDRLDRMGQTGQVQADFLVAPGSLSERILGAAIRKGQTVHKVLDRQHELD